MSMRVIGDKALALRLEQMSEAVRSAAGQAVAVLVLKLQRKIVRDKLNGQVLKVQTGTLARSIDQVVLPSADGVRGIVSTNVEYARKHEYGAKGSESVKAHLRTVKQAFGKPISPRKVAVRAHSRKVDYPERSFMRSALADMREEILADMEAAVKGATK